MDPRRTSTSPRQADRSPFLAVLQTVRGVVGWLIGFIALTEADRMKAGIIRAARGKTDRTASAAFAFAPSKPQWSIHRFQQPRR